MNKGYIKHETARKLAQAAGLCLHDLRKQNPYIFGAGRSWGKIDRDAFFAWLNTNTKNKTTPQTFEACPVCGCTDVEVSAWVHANTGIVSNDEGPTDSAFCPQCDIAGDGDISARNLLTVNSEKPFNP